MNGSKVTFCVRINGRVVFESNEPRKFALFMKSKRKSFEDAGVEQYVQYSLIDITVPLVVDFF